MSEMKPEVARGYRQLLLVVVGITVPSLLGVVLRLALGLQGDPGFMVFQFVLALAFGIFLLRGYSWARYYMGLGFCLNAGLVFLSSLLNLTTLLGLVGLVISVCYAAAAWALLKSEPIDAYFEYRRRQREPVLSLRGDEDA